MKPLASGLLKTLVSYLRVSTRKQGQSGLGLDGQRAAVAEYAQRNGATVIAEYVEIESGKRSDRPELMAAIAHAKRSKSQLIVAKMDRLSRNVAFLSTLMESGADFVAVDNPTATKLTVHILAAVAEDELRRISDRTKAGLAALKRRGELLGSARPDHWAGREDRRLAGSKLGASRSAANRRKAAIAEYADLLPKIQEYKRAGDSLRTIASNLNADGQTTRSGGPWNPVTVRNVLKYAPQPQEQR
jgi:DNA invertase Pin-like site-specific DNA recombinase